MTLKQQQNTMIYLIEDKASDTVKIGYTKDDPHGRLSTFQTGNSNELKLVYVLKGDRDEELRLKKYFKEYNIRGEWFKLNDDIIRYFYVNQYDYYKDTWKYRKEKEHLEYLERQTHIKK